VNDDGKPLNEVTQELLRQAIEQHPEFGVILLDVITRGEERQDRSSSVSTMDSRDY
jgi:hypothetical protein